MTWEPISNIIADDPYCGAVYAKKFNLLNTQAENNSRGMPEQQRNSSELSRNPSRDNSRQQKVQTWF